MIIGPNRKTISAEVKREAPVRKVMYLNRFRNLKCSDSSTSQISIQGPLFTRSNLALRVRKWRKLVKERGNDLAETNPQ